MKNFNQWLHTHKCSSEELWKLQNMLGDCYPGSTNHLQAMDAWDKATNVQGTGINQDMVTKPVGLIDALKDKELIMQAVRQSNEDQRTMVKLATAVEALARINEKAAKRLVEWKVGSRNYLLWEKIADISRETIDKIKE